MTEANTNSSSNSANSQLQPTAATPLLSTQGRQAIDDPRTNLEPGSFARKLGTFDGFTLLISVIIGSGIFASPSAVDTNVPSPGAALLVWLAGGILAWTGASTMAELGAAFPGEGGLQPYLRYVYGDFAGFLAAWNWVFCVMPATLAILSLVFIETVYEALVPGFDASKAGGWPQKGFSVLIMLVMIAANCVSTRTSTALGNIFAVIKLGTVGIVALTGLVVAMLHATHPWRKRPGGEEWYKRNWFHSRPSVTPDGTIDWDEMTNWNRLGHYAAALYAGLWAYASWDKANYAAGELSNPAKQLPLAINLALPTVMVCYVLVNAAYYILLPWDSVGLTDSIAVTAFGAILGKTAAIAIAILIAIVVAGALNGNIFVVGRLTVAASKRGYLPVWFAGLGNPLRPHYGSQRVESSEEPDKEPTPEAPIPAFVLSAAVSTAYILLGNFRALLTFDGMAEYSFFFFTIIAAILLRFREPELNRPYKPPIVLPIIFAIVSGAVVVRGAIFAPVQTLTLASILAAGAMGYAASSIWKRKTRRSEGTAQRP